MSDLASKAEVLETYAELFDMFDDSKEICKELCKVYDKIMGLPTIDTVPVVRCKDCKHRDTEDGLCKGRGWPMQLVPDDGFCDKGKRSEE